MRKIPIVPILLAASIALNVGLLLRGGEIVPQGKSWLDLPWQVITAMLGGGIALWTYVATKGQKDREFEQQTLDARFSDVLDKLSKDSPQVRSAAATRLTELALTKPVFQEGEGYPFFEAATHQFLTGLVLEGEPSLRRHYQEQLYRLIENAPEEKAIDLALTARRMARASTERMASQSRHSDRASVEAALKEAFGDNFPDPMRAFASLMRFYLGKPGEYDPGWRLHVGNDHPAQFAKEAFESRLLNDSALQLFSVCEESRGLRLPYEFSFAILPTLTFTDFAGRPITIGDCALDTLTIDDAKGEGETEVSLGYTYVNQLELDVANYARVHLKSCLIDRLSFGARVDPGRIEVVDGSIGSLDVTRVASEAVRESLIASLEPFVKAR